MMEHSDVVRQTTNVVLRATSKGRASAERDRDSAWRYLARPSRPDDERPGRVAGVLGLETTRRLMEIGQKYDRITIDVEGDEVDKVLETDLLAALLVIRELREKLQSDEVMLLKAARRKRITWARLAEALGLKSRQAAERRYLQLRSDLDEAKGTRLKQAERVEYARSLRDQPDGPDRADRRDTSVAGLARRLVALPDLAERAAAPWPDQLAEALAGLAALETRGNAHSVSEHPKRYGSMWRTEYTQKLSDLLDQARDAERVDLSGHPRLLADINEHCAAADTADPS